jgi:hypothetical protein
MAAFKCEMARVFRLGLTNDYERMGAEGSDTGPDRVE